VWCKNNRDAVNIDTISASVTKLLSAAERQERRLFNELWRLEEWDHQHPGQTPPNGFMEEEDEARRALVATLQALYISTVGLLDALGLSEYLAQLYETVSKTFDTDTAAKLDATDEDWPPYRRSGFLAKLRLFLIPLGMDSSANFYRQQGGVKILEAVLENTAQLLMQWKIKPKSETDVCKPIRGLLKVVFEGTHKPPAGRFNKSFKYYKPDILIPDLFAAIEYKYIRNQTAFNTALGEIADDVGGYTGDPQYKLFYAVFYFTGNFFTQKRFISAWKEKQFPEDWVPIYVMAA
jgi:hypothetical protein